MLKKRAVNTKVAALSNDRPHELKTTLTAE